MPKVWVDVEDEPGGGHYEDTETGEITYSKPRGLTPEEQAKTNQMRAEDLFRQELARLGKLPIPIPPMNLPGAVGGRNLLPQGTTPEQIVGGGKGPSTGMPAPLAEGWTWKWDVIGEEPMWGEETVIGPDGKPTTKRVIVGKQNIYGWVPTRDTGGADIEAINAKNKADMERLLLELGFREREFGFKQKSERMQWLMGLLAVWMQLPLSQRPVLMAILKEWGIDMTDILERMGNLGNIPALQGEARIAPGTVGR